MNGYFNTGDLGEVDKDGYLYYRGRFKDIIKISGMNIHPVEIEHKIKKCSSVIECAVIGEKNEHFGELIKSIIVAKNQKTLTQIQIKKYLRNNLNEYEIPQIIEFVDELPKNKLGKIDKKKLKNINFKNNININDNVTKYLNLINKIK